MIPEVGLQLALDRFLSSRPFYPCCLLVHADVLRLQRAGETLVAQYGWPVLSLGTVLSEALHPLVPERRPGQVQRVVMGAVQGRAPGPVLVTDIDILFEPSLSLDPLRLLRETSRLAPLVVTWPGSFVQGVLAYATADPPHAHYRAWRRPELCEACIVTL